MQNRGLARPSENHCFDVLAAVVDSPIKWQNGDGAVVKEIWMWIWMWIWIWIMDEGERWPQEFE